LSQISARQPTLFKNGKLQSKYDSLNKSLKSIEFEGQKEKYLLAKIDGCLGRVKGVFTRLTSINEKRKAARGDQLFLYQELESRMTGILLAESQQMVNLAARLHGLIQTAMKRVHEKTSLIILGFALILGVLISVVSYFVSRRLARSIGNLQRGVAVLGSGNLDFKVGTTAKDEIGHLSRAFDKMTTDLKETTTSIAALNKEIDERKQAEGRFSAMFEHMSSGVAVYESVDNGEDFVFRAFNPAAEGITRISRNGVLGNSLLDIFPQMGKSGLLGTLQRVWKTGREEYIPPFYYKDENREGWRENRIYKLPTGEVVALFDDVTERKQAEEALRKSEEKYRSMMESMDDPVYICSPDYHVEYMNPAMINKMGGRNAVGEPCYEVLHKLDEKCPWYVHDKVQQGENRVTEIVSPIDNRAYNVSHFPIHNPDGSISKLSIYRDVTEKRKMEAQFQQITKMEAIATLAGGVAHEFNNALMAVMGNIELLRMDLPENERTDKYLEAMKDSGHRMSRLTAQLLAYSEGGKYNAKNLKLDDFVIEILPILQHDLSPEVRVETNFPKDISYVRADNAQMQMVLSAILANSNEAIEDEGIIKITAGSKDIDEDFIKEHPDLKPGPHVCLTVEDDGKGMDEKTTKRIFEPFFTTKFQGRGMGMAATYGIIQSHDGAITVDSEPGKGTVVRIYLPAIETKVEVKKKVIPRPTVERTMGEGTILVIEDEEPLVMMFSQILERLGYLVLQARTGKEAVEFAKTFDGRIDLALLDIKLPDMEGSKVYPLIMEARPDLKVIVCSGYSIHGPAQAILDAGAEGFIQKPFSMAPFSEKLKEVLEGK
jgi:signal transduction histidine kinase/HAMP domain-containing protein